MSLDSAPLKTFPHKLALIDVQFLENVSTRYLWHVLFVWRLLMWREKKVFKGGSTAVSFACKTGKARAFASLADPQQYFQLQSMWAIWRPGWVCDRARSSGSFHRQAQTAWPGHHATKAHGHFPPTESKCLVSRIKPNFRKGPSSPWIFGDGKNTQACKYSKSFILL